MKAKKAKPARPPPKGDTADLQVRYGKIGISAVAAAVRYHRGANGDHKTEQSLRADSEPRRIGEIAA